MQIYLCDRRCKRAFQGAVISGPIWSRLSSEKRSHFHELRRRQTSARYTGGEVPLLDGTPRMTAFVEQLLHSDVIRPTL